MTPILYTSDCVDKIAFLSETVRCEVTEERNGVYQLELEYPVAGNYFSDLNVDLVIKAKPNQTSDNQFFRITEITKPMNGLVTVYANHISYDLSGYPVAFYGSASSISADAAISGILGTAYETIQHGFTLQAGDVDTLKPFAVVTCSARAALGGVEGSVLDTYGGEFEFDNFKVCLHKNRGADNGVRIAYGKNMTDMKLSLNTDASYTGIMPFCYDEEENLIILSEGIINVQNQSGIEDKILIMDFSNSFEDGVVKNAVNLRTLANDYLDANDINAITGSMTVEFVDLSKATAFDLYSALESVNLCDTVKVIHTKLGVSTSMKVIKTIYDTLSERYIKLELGTPRSNFADTIAQITNAANEAKKKADESTSQLEAEFQQAISDATAAITGASGGHVVLNPSQNPQEILILMDSDDIDTATKLWRWNSAGIAYSDEGYNGNYKTALLGDDGKLVINNVTSRLISANLIRTGLIQSAASVGNGSSIKNMEINLDDGVVSVRDIQGETRLADGHIDFYYNNQFSYRLGQSGAYSMTVENGSYHPVFSINSSNSIVHFNNSEGTQTVEINGSNGAMNFYNGYIRFYGKSKYIYFEDTPSGIMAGSPGSAIPMIQFNGNGNMVIGSTSGMNNCNYYCPSSYAHHFFVGNTNKLEVKANGVYVGNKQIVTASADEYTTTSEDTSMIESNIMDYFNNSVVAITPTTTINTAAHSSTVIDDEGNPIGEEIPASSETVLAGAELTTVPAILTDENGENVNLYSMCSLMWEAVKNLNQRVKDLEEALNDTQI